MPDDVPVPPEEESEEGKTDKLPDREGGTTALDEEKARLQEAIRRQLAARIVQPTQKLPEEELDAIPDARSPAFGFRHGAAAEYLLMPIALRRTGIPAGAPVWRIEFHGLAPGAAPVGMDISGDTVIGRRIGGSLADIDLEGYGGAQKGVSRRHALLRPTQRCLFLIDLGSTNGTMINALLMGLGVAKALANNDTLTFGSLTCTIKLIDGPGLRPAE
jgi:hypothetical protein